MIQYLGSVIDKSINIVDTIYLTDVSYFSEPVFGSSKCNSSIFSLVHKCSSKCIMDFTFHLLIVIWELTPELLSR